MGTARSFRDLTVYQKAVDQVWEIYRLTLRFPKSETYGFCDQIPRSSRAVAAMIAESWGRRRYESDFINKFTLAIGESNEPQCWLDHAVRCGHLTEDEYRIHDDAWQHIGAMLNRMIQSSSTFCTPIF